MWTQSKSWGFPKAFQFTLPRQPDALKRTLMALACVSLFASELESFLSAELKRALEWSKWRFGMVKLALWLVKVALWFGQSGALGCQSGALVGESGALVGESGA